MEEEKPIGSIAEADLTRYFTANKVNPECPMCKAHEWAHMEDDDNLGFLLATQGVDGKDGPKVMPVAVLVCGNCGTVWQVVREKILSWIKENPGE